MKQGNRKQAEVISDALELLEDSVLQEAMQKRQSVLNEQTKKQEKKDIWKKWRLYGSMAACAALLVVASRYVPRFWSSGQTEPDSGFDIVPEYAVEKDTVSQENRTEDDVWQDDIMTEEKTTEEQKEVEETAEEQAAYGFTLGEDIIYFPISFDDRIRYGLLKTGADDPSDGGQTEAMGLTPENTYQITKQDLGEVMGTVQGSADQDLLGCTVYHFAQFPNLDSICIVEQEGSYAFYTADWILLSEESGGSFDRVLAAYNLPETAVKLEVEDRFGNQLVTITDKEDIHTLCTLLSGKTDIGMQANNERYAKLWQDIYGNNAVSYDGESFYYSDEVDYDAVHEFWHENQRVLWLTTERGFRFLMQYNPSVQTMECFGYYDLEKEEIAVLNELLQSGE